VFGVTFKLAPVPTTVPPQDPLYHFQLAPEASLPPFTVNVVVLPLQITMFPVIELGGIDVSLTDNTIDLQIVLLQNPFACKK
jgi:hypothetical protein